MNTAQLSITVVLYNTAIEKLKKNIYHTTIAVSSAQKAGLLSSCALYFIDNASLPIHSNDYKNFIASLPKETTSAITIITIKSDYNRGHGKGHNLAIKQINSDYHLILNPDVYMDNDALIHAISYMNEHPNAGLLSPAIHGENGKRHYLCRQIPNFFDITLRILPVHFIKKIFLKRMQAYEMRDKNYNEIINNIPSLSGCYMFVRTSILKKIDGFDPRFFLYYDDTDLTRKILNVSETAYVPSVKIIHEWQAGSHHNYKLLLLHVHDAIRYFKKWGGWFKAQN